MIGYTGLKLSDEEFNWIKEMVLGYVGIKLQDYKKDQLSYLINKRKKVLNISTFRDYLDCLKTNVNEKDYFINMITNQWTYFFREPYQFDFLEKQILPQLFKEKKKIRFWSAGCSTGEEPYSLAMVIYEYFKRGPIPIDYDIKILATDVNDEALKIAKEGLYENNKIENLEFWKDWFVPHVENNKIYAKVDDRLKLLISFLHLNLLLPWPMKGSFDVIFCRNVMQYLSEEAQINVFQKFDQYLATNGFLIIGYPENLSGINKKYKHIQNKIFQKME